MGDAAAPTPEDEEKATKYMQALAAKAAPGKDLSSRSQINSRSFDSCAPSSRPPGFDHGGSAHPTAAPGTSGRPTTCSRRQR